MNSAARLLPVFVSLLAATAAFAQATDLEELLNRPEPTLSNARQVELWDVMRSSNLPDRVNEYFARDPDVSLIVADFRQWLADDAVADSESVRLWIYQFAAHSPIAQSEPGAEFLLGGLEDESVKVQSLCANGLLKAPADQRASIDVRLAEYLSDPDTPSLERQIFLEHLVVWQKTSEALADVALKLLQNGVPNEVEAYWSAAAVMQYAGTEPIVPLLDPKTDSRTLQGILTAFGIQHDRTDGTLGTDEIGRDIVRAEVAKLFTHRRVEVRKFALMSSYSLLGPNPYSTDDSQIAINERLIAAVKLARTTETDAALIQYIDDYILLSFDQDGRLKSKEEFRRDLSTR